MKNCWTVLGIAATNDQAAIKKAYAVQLKQCRPDDDPESYQRLREAFEQARQWRPEAAGPSEPQTLAVHQTAVNLLNNVFQQPTYGAQATALKSMLADEQDLFVRMEIEDALRDIGHAWPADAVFPALAFMEAAKAFDWYAQDSEAQKYDHFEDLLERIWLEYDLKTVQSDSIRYHFWHFCISPAKRTAMLMHRNMPAWTLRTAGFFGFGRKIKQILQQFENVYPDMNPPSLGTVTLKWWRSYFSEKWHLGVWQHSAAFAAGSFTAFFSMAFIARGLDFSIGFQYGFTVYSLYLMTSFLIQLLRAK